MFEFRSSGAEGGKQAVKYTKPPPVMEAGGQCGVFIPYSNNLILTSNGKIPLYDVLTTSLWKTHIVRPQHGNESKATDALS
jgi:hypothetical protein